MIKSILESAERIKQGDSITFTIDELIAMEDGDMPKHVTDFLERHKKAVETV
jgi:hypothetical protein